MEQSEMSVDALGTDADASGESGPVLPIAAGIDCELAPTDDGLTVRITAPAAGDAAAEETTDDGRVVLYAATHAREFYVSGQKRGTIANELARTFDPLDAKAEAVVDRLCDRLDSPFTDRDALSRDAFNAVYEADVSSFHEMDTDGPVLWVSVRGVAEIINEVCSHTDHPAICDRLRDRGVLVGGRKRISDVRASPFAPDLIDYDSDDLRELGTDGGGGSSATVEERFRTEEL